MGPSTTASREPEPCAATNTNSPITVVDSAPNDAQKSKPEPAGAGAGLGSEQQQSPNATATVGTAPTDDGGNAAEQHADESYSDEETDEKIAADGAQAVIPSIGTSLGRPVPAHHGGGYNALKSFNNQVYTGMAIGGSHTWTYDEGIWKETKLEPDLWTIDFDTTKRRAGGRNAPKGSGAPEGMEYHWLIVAHQHVIKVDANTYTTRLTGSKYKLAHKGPAASGWSVPTVKAQREREVELLEDAKRRVLGLPPVTAGEKVKAEKKEKGQQRLDSLFAKTPPRKNKIDVSSPGNSEGRLKRKRGDEREEEGSKDNEGGRGLMAKWARRQE